ncbi:peptide chain release factor 1 [Striga asiatica]|uniref:Peptide chain release factor 1 n=1 Tax=Striga asiatica TaxID=4170 RepID=A0A5A7PMH4_STRAF|nr:peptide chain release factor 1 [Striga asiatica]
MNNIKVFDRKRRKADNNQAYIERRRQIGDGGRKKAIKIASLYRNIVGCLKPDECFEFSHSFSVICLVLVVDYSMCVCCTAEELVLGRDYGGPNGIGSQRAPCVLPVSLTAF